MSRETTHECDVKKKNRKNEKLHSVRNTEIVTIKPRSEKEYLVRFYCTHKESSQE